MDAIQVFKNEKENEITEIFQDENAESPREWSNLGKIYAEHRRYTLGDKDATKEEAENAPVCLNLYMLDHSGITISTNSFNDPWDSGQVGYIYATKEAILNEYKVKRISKKLLEKVRRVLLAEVANYDQYLRGDVYGFVRSKLVSCDHGDTHKDHIDSCWGYYSSSSEDLLAEIIGNDNVKDWTN